MSFLLIFAIAFSLAMDAFAVSVGISIGLVRLSKGQTLRLAVFFGFFQFMMPLLGWQAGRSILIKQFESYDHWLAFGLLLLIGGRMIYEFFKPEKSSYKNQADPTKGFLLIILSIATSIDALAVGLSLAALDVPILYPAGIIGGIAFLMTVLGTKLGPLLGRIAGKSAELLGGLILILIGLKVLADHL